MAIIQNNNGKIEISLGLASAYRAALSLARDTGLTQLVKLGDEKIALIAPNGNEQFFNARYEYLFGEVR